MAQTKQEIRRAWDKENMRTFAVAVHKENEKDIIEYIEKRQAKGEHISAIFKEGVSELIERDNE